MKHYSTSTKSTVFLCALFICLCNISSAQIFHGSHSVNSNFGIGIGGVTHLSIGRDYGISNHLSGGFDLRYNFGNVSGELVPFDVFRRINFFFRLDIHASNIFSMKYSDVLIGGNFNMTTQGLHLTYQYFFEDKFGAYARAQYFLRKNNEGLSYVESQTRLVFEIGFIKKKTKRNAHREFYH